VVVEGVAGGGAEHPLLAAAALQLEEYFGGRRRTFTLPLDPVGTEFQKACWRVLAEIPYGETISYGQQAARVGKPKAARAVGAANGRNPLSIVVPCHRVVAADGALTGFGGGLETKRWLLEHEQRVLGESLTPESALPQEPPLGPGGPTGCGRPFEASGRCRRFRSLD